MRRKGLGKGSGKGYKNILGYDPRVHSDSRRGIKQPQSIKVLNLLRKSPILEQKKMGVILAYGDGLKVRNLNYVSSDIRSIDDAQEIVKLVPYYNDYDGNKVAKALGELNPKMIESIQFGRESSPVLYIKIPYWTNQAFDDKGEKREYTDEEKKQFIKEVYNTFKKAGVTPDEFGMTDYGNHLAGWYEKLYEYNKDIDGIRLWWD